MKFTIITATRNAAATIRTCIRSVMQQDWPATEHLILDGGSTDNTLNAVRDCQSPLVRLHAEADNGVYEAFNHGLRLATGDAVAFLNADDLYLPGALQRVAAAFERAPETQCLHGNIEVNGRIVRPRQGPLALGGARIYHPATFMRRELLQQAGGFNPEFAIAADLDLFLRLRKQQTPFLYVDEPFTRFALGGLSTRHFWKTQAEIRRVLLRNGYSKKATAALMAAETVRGGVPLLLRQAHEALTRLIPALR